MWLTRIEAIEKFGAHYKLNRNDRIVYEHLGHIDPPGGPLSLYAQTHEEAVQQIVESETELAEKRIDVIEPMLSRLSTRLLIWRAKNGLCRKADRITYFFDYREKQLEADKKDLREGIKVKTNWLPGTISIPDPIDIDAPVYLLKTLYFQNGIEVVEDEIASRIVRRTERPSSKGGEYDYKFHFITRSNMAFYQDGFNAGEIDQVECQHIGVNVFFSKEAVERGARKVAQSQYEKIRPWI